jgi:hypothetical protein
MVYFFKVSAAEWVTQTGTVHHMPLYIDEKAERDKQRHSSTYS